MITRPQGLLGTTAAFKGWRGRKRTRSRTHTKEITAEHTRDNQPVDKATLGERQSETSPGKEGQP
jgi:Flp pilus assembly protein TadB